MKYKLDIYDTHEDYIASEEFSMFESSTPIPIPNVGDCIYVPSGCGSDSKQAKDVKVAKRLFTYHPGDQNDEAYARVELYCEFTSGS
jgi:N-acetylneuraminic acid mutarotase